MCSFAQHHDILHPIFPMFITCHAYIGAPKGVTVLEYELPEPEE